MVPRSKETQMNKDTLQRAYHLAIAAMQDGGMRYGHESTNDCAQSISEQVDYAQRAVNCAAVVGIYALRPPQCATGPAWDRYASWLAATIFLCGQAEGWNAYTGAPWDASYPG
jgi:hypothetical protein